MALSLLTIGAAACGSDSTSSGSTAAPTTNATTASSSDNSDLCAARDGLTESVQALKDVDVVKSGTNGVTAAVDSIKDDLAIIKAEASAEVGPQVTALESALGALEASMQTVDTTGKAAAVLTAAASVATAGSALVSGLQTARCS